MAADLNPFLNFKRETREAMEFYKSVFGGNLMMQTYEDFHAVREPSDAGKIMYAVLEGNEGFKFMAADAPAHVEYKTGNNFGMAMSGADESLMHAYYEKLSKDGSVEMAWDKALWGAMFGQCIDKYGVRWLINVSHESA